MQYYLGIKNKEKIVGNDNNRIWFIFLNKSEGPIFEIVSLSYSGKILDSNSF